MFMSLSQRLVAFHYKHSDIDYPHLAGGISISGILACDVCTMLLNGFLSFHWPIVSRRIESRPSSKVFKNSPSNVLMSSVPLCLTISFILAFLVLPWIHVDYRNAVETTLPA
jgi:hypothetical protein